jgi:hypothetical protein
MLPLKINRIPVVTIKNQVRMSTIKINKIFAFLNFVLLGIFGIITNANGQQISYSEPDKNETKQANFDIIGKYNDKVLIFKNLRNSSYISVYDLEMNLIENVDLPFMPPRMLEYDILPFSDHSYIFFQYQQRNVAYLMAVKIGVDGKPLTSPLELDTTHINYNASRRVYSVIANEDKSKFMAFKINTNDENKFVFETNLYSPEMEAIHATKVSMLMNDRYDFLTDFFLDNEGNLVFGRGRRRSADDNISQFFLLTKPAKSDTFTISELKFDGITLDEVKLRIDNNNNRYLFTAFYYKGRKNTNIEGVANAMYDKTVNDWTVRNIVPLSDELRADATSDNNLKTAFNDFFIRQILIRKDGGFVMNAESVYTTSRGGGGFNRWDMFGNPAMMGGFGGGGWGMGGMGMGSPYYGSGAWGSSTRYHADNVIVLVFDKDGRLDLSNVIRKTQYDDQSEAMVSYQTINTGNALHYLYNRYDKREVILSYQSIDSDGKVTRNPTIRTLDPKYSFMPRYARQVAARTIIIPSIVRNYLCFARIEF